jgi:hypothetical protein
MTQQEIQTALQANIGKKVKVAFDSHAETVVVISADPDGFLCRACPVGLRQPTAEFWLAYKEVSNVDRADQ